MNKTLSEIPITELQDDAASIFAEENGGIAYWRVGEGKTRIALAAWQYLLTTVVTSQLLVICRPASFYDWQQEAIACGIDPDRLVFISYGLLSRSQTAAAVVADISKNGFINAIVIDELWLFKNPKAERSQNANALAKTKPTIGLSGSIMTASRLEDVYGQAYAINKHRRIAPNLTAFRMEYLTGISQFGGVKHVPKRGAYKKLMEACQGWTHIHMPKTSERKIRESIIHVDVTSQQEDMFRELRDCYSIANLGLELNNAANVITKIQQVSNGWIKDDAGNRVLVSADKPTRCFELCEELLDAGERVIVWCAFREDVAMLSLDSPFLHLTMVGGQPFDIEKWNSGKYPVVFATEASGSSINHFAQVKYAIYFSMSQKWTDFQQSRGRTDRKSSTHDECYYYFLQTRGSLDDAVLRGVRQSASSESALLKIGRELQDWLCEK